MKKNLYFLALFTFLSFTSYSQLIITNNGICDSWNISGLGGQTNAKIYIFERYEKLLKQISSRGVGWDGTYNGHLHWQGIISSK